MAGEPKVKEQERRDKGIREEVLTRFTERLDAALRNAYAAGYDLAVSDFAMSAEKTIITAEFVYLKPGEDPPPGRDWRVYKTSARPRMAPLLRAQADAMEAACTGNHL